jgi:hypothetical protein
MFLMFRVADSLREPKSLKMEDERQQPKDYTPVHTDDRANGEPRPTPPTEEPADIHENVVKANVVDIQRYLRWADKILRRAKDEAA